MEERINRVSGEVEQARSLVFRYGWNSMAYQILNPGLSRWFTEDNEAVVAYVDAGRYRVVAGAPVCDLDRMNDVTERFEAESLRHGRRTCYFGALDRLKDILGERGVQASISLGAQPVWTPAYWRRVFDEKASLRAQRSRARNKGVHVTLWTPEQVSQHQAVLRCLEEWIGTRGLPPMHFLVEWNLLSDLYDRRVFVAEKDDAVVGFLIATPIPLRKGWLVEQIVRGHAAPNGTNELLLDRAIEWMASEGAEYVTLGLSPLAAVPGEKAPQPPVAIGWILRWVRKYGDRFYHFEGLERFKSKFCPEHWEPIYAVTNTSRITPGALYAIAGAFGGMSPIRFIVRALLRSIRKT